MRAYPVFQFCASMLRPSRHIGTAELHKGAILFDIVRFTDRHRATYVNLRKNNTHKISRIFRTECQKSFRSYVHQHACAEKTHILLYLFAKDTACTREKTHLGLLLDLSSKDTAIELMYINMQVRGNFWNWQLLKIRLMYRNHAHALIECRTLDKRC